MVDVVKDDGIGLNLTTRLLNLLLRGARPLGMSWKDFHESRAKKALQVLQ
jgi:hypothetical protein